MRFRDEESAPLLEFLHRHSQRPDFTCRFRWTQGAVAFWDNRATMHYPLNDYHGARRIMHRVTIDSMRGELPPVPATAFANGCIAYDLVYGKGMTPFLRLAQDSGGARLADGIGMLVEQAAEAFAWWRGVRPLTGDVIDALRTPFA